MFVFSVSVRADIIRPDQWCFLRLLSGLMGAEKPRVFFKDQSESRSSVIIIVCVVFPLSHHIISVKGEGLRGR